MKCRYEQGPCTFPGAMRRHFRCQDGSCPEQGGRVASRTQQDAPTRSDAHQHAPVKPDVPVTESEEVKMAQGVRGTSGPVGACDRCGKEAKLGTSKHAPGKRLCVSCTVRAFKRSKQGLPLDESAARKAPEKRPAGASAPAKPTAPAKPRPEPIAPQRPEQGQGGGLSFTFRVTLEPGLTAEAVVEILRQLPAGAVLV